MIKNYLAFLVFAALSINISAQNSYWFKSVTNKTNVTNSEIPLEHVEFSLNTESLLSVFTKAPNRLIQKRSQILVALPNEKGELDTYQLFEASNLHPELAAKYPQIQSFIGKSIRNGSVARISYAPSLGLSVSITNLDRPTTLIKPIDNNNDVYAVYSRAQLNESNSDFECATIESARRDITSSGLASRNANDSNLRLYRAAISTTGEYSQFYLDGTETTDEERKGKVLAAINQSLTRINGIFERDFGITMQLVPNNDEIIFLNSSTDPYSVDNSVIQNTIDSTIGDSNYDVGHLFAYESSIYGNAGCIACVCTTGSKGSAYTVHSNPNSDHFNLIASHEFGHQYGGLHVQSSANCRSAYGLQEVEPGSGSSIMGYAGICSPNVQNNPDDYFNYVDIRDVAQWTINDSSCAQLTGLPNAAPSANAGMDFTIPKSTAFVLEGSGSDTDGDQISFCWEENDPEDPFSTDTPQPTRQFGPMFRSKLPVATPNRYMPQLADVVSGNLTPTWEMLPSVSRTMDFVLTVRDNNPSVGQTASDEMTVTVTDTAGPFVVTSQATSEIWNVGEYATITWDVANTNVAPVNATEVDVFLSIDGGFTYPYTLATNITNDGSETFNIPNVPATTEARVMVRGSNNIFYAINSSNFEVRVSEFIMNFAETNIAECKPNDAVYNFVYNTFLGFEEMTNFSVSNLPAGATATFSQPSASEDNTSVQLTISNTNLVANGSYDITVIGISDTVEKQTTITLEVYDSNLLAPTLLFPENNATAINVNETFNWQDDINAASYEIEIALDANFNNTVVSEIASSNSYTVSGLDFNTVYYWRVLSINACGISEYSNVNEFITFCVAPSNIVVTNILSDSAQVSWQENGNATSWEIEVVEVGNSPTGVGVSTSENPYIINTLNSLTSYDVYVRSECGGGNYSDWTGPVTFTTAANFCNGDHFYDSGGASGNYENGEDITTVIVPSDGYNSVTVIFNSFQLEGCCDYLRVYDGLDTNATLIGQYNGSTIPSSFTANNPSGALTFRFTSDSSVTYSGWDATVVCETITCPNISNLLADNVSLSSADLSWTAGGNELTWELEFGTTGFAQGSGTLINLSDTQYDLIGLNSSTSYDVYVRGNCSANPGEDDSSWIGPITFTTLADFCSGDHFYDSGGENGNYQNGEDITTVITPSDGNNSVTVIFNSFQLEGCCDYLSVYDGLDINATLIGQYNGSTIPSSFTANNPSGALTFRFTSDSSVTYSGWDATVICETITCPDLSDISASNITLNSADLSWTVGGSELTWEIEYGLSGFTQGSGTIVNISTNPTTLNGLDLETSYDVYIRGNCGANPGEDDSNWVGPFSFTTLGLDPPAYLTAELTNDTLGEVTLDWGEPSGFIGSWLVNFDHGCNGSDGEDEVVFNADGTFNSITFGNQGTWVLEGNQLTYTFENGFQYYGTIEGNYMSGTTSADGCWFANKITGLDYITFTTGNLTNTGEANLNTNSFVTSAPDAFDFIEYNVYRDNQLITTTTETSYIDTLPNYGLYEYYITAVYDEGESNPSNTEIVEWLSCPEPTDLVVISTSSDSADLSWIAGGSEITWEIEYGLAGFTLGTGTSITVMSNPYTLTGLNSSSNYDVYVRASCGENPGEDDSYWVGPISLTTLADYCNGDHFYDSGGANGNYQNYEDITTVIAPSNGNNSVTVIFNSFQLEGCCDYLRVYNGLDVNAPLIGQYNGSTIPSSFTADNPSGALTFWFTSDGSVTYSGWDATVICETITCPDLSDFSVDNVSLSSADLSWIAGGSELTWEIEYGLSGFIQGNGTIVMSSTNPHVLENLELATTYDVYIRGNCGANPGEDDSNWIGPVTFTTLDITSPGYLVAELTDALQGEVTLTWGDSGFVGSWMLNFDHSCSNSYSQVEIIFYEDFTFSIPSEGNSGTWEVDGDQVTWTYLDGFQYTGVLTGNYMEGNTSGNGCWFADKIEPLDYTSYVVGNLSSTREVNSNVNEEIFISSTAYGFLEYNVYRNNVFLASTTETTYIDILTVSGTYDYYITSVFSEGESEASNIETIVWENLNIIGNELEGIEVFPNPVDSELNINSTTNIESIEVFSMLGQKIMSVSSNSNTNKLNMTRLEAGTYFVKVWSNQRFNIYKVIKK